MKHIKLYNLYESTSSKVMPINQATPSDLAHFNIKA